MCHWRLYQRAASGTQSRLFPSWHCCCRCRHGCWVGVHEEGLQRGLESGAAVATASGLDCMRKFVCLLVGCLTSQQHASISQGRICIDNFPCCHTEIEVADQTFYLTQSQYTDTGPTRPSADPIVLGAWQGSHWSTKFKALYDSTTKNPVASGIRTPDLPLPRRTP